MNLALIPSCESAGMQGMARAPVQSVGVLLHPEGRMSTKRGSPECKSATLNTNRGVSVAEILMDAFFRCCMLVEKLYSMCLCVHSAVMPRLSSIHYLSALISSGNDTSTLAVGGIHTP